MIRQRRLALESCFDYTFDWQLYMLCIHQLFTPNFGNLYQVQVAFKEIIWYVGVCTFSHFTVLSIFIVYCWLANRSLYSAHTHTHTCRHVHTHTHTHTHTQAHSWHSCITRSIELTEIYRQSDKQFIAVLQNIRIGRCPPAVAEILRSTATNQIEKGGIRATQLYTHTEDVESTNLRALRSLGGEGRKFTAVDSDPQMSKTVDHLCPVGSCIELKVGAQVREKITLIVMCTEGINYYYCCDRSRVDGIVLGTMIVCSSPVFL